MSDTTKPTLTHYLVSMTRGETKGSKSPMWRCKTQDGERVNVFKHTDPAKNSARFFEAAGYLPDMEAMVVGQEITWWNSPIQIVMIKNGDWWEITHVNSRPEGAEPDPVESPDKALYQAKALAWADMLFWDELPVYFLDVEATGLEPEDEIVSITVGDQAGIMVFNEYVRPTAPERLLQVNPKTGQSAADITGITPAMLANAPTFPEIYPRLRELLQGRVWVIYNAAYDTDRLGRDCRRHNLVPITPIGVNDAMQMFAEFYGEWTPVYRHFVSKSLSFAAEHLGITIQGREHESRTDVLTLHQVCDELATRYAEASDV